MKAYLEGDVVQNTLFDSKLFVGSFGSYLLHISSLLNWANSKGLYFPETNPPIESYKFVQVELLLREYVRDNLSITPMDGFRAVQINPELKNEKFAQHPVTARFLLATYGSNKMINRIVESIETGELKILNFEDKAPITDKQLDALLSSLSQVHKPSAGSEGLIDYLSQLPHIHTDYIETLQTEAKVDDEKTKARDAGQAGAETLQINDKSKKPQFREKGRQQMDAIIAELQKLGHDPLRLPALVSGQRSAKAEVLFILDKKGLFTAPTAFENAWQTLTKRRQIAYETNTQ